MRITNQLQTGNAIQYMNDNLSKLTDLQNRVSSGKTFQNPSDDPAGFSAAVSLRSTMQQTDTYINTINVSSDWMSATEYSLGQLVDLATRAVNLGQQGLSDTVGADERSAALGTEVDAILQNAVQIGNTTQQGSYLFSGTKVQTQPFSMVDANTPGYAGNNGKLQREISPNQTVNVNADGNATITPFLQSLVDVRNALNTNNTDDLKTALTSLNSSMNTIVQVRTATGATQRQLQTSLDRLNNTQTELKSLLSQKEDVNMAEAISQMSNQQTVYQTVLEVGQRSISALNLFDYLR